MTTRYADVHKTLQGLGDARPMALQVVRDEGLEGNWRAARFSALFTTGATLYLTARYPDKAKKALGDIAQSPRVHLLQLDLGPLGVMATPEGRTKDGFEIQLGTNYLSHFLLFLLLRPALLAAASPQRNSRVIFLSSITHRYSEVVFEYINLSGEYEKWKAYGQSKCALLWAANEIDRRCASQGLRAFSVQPGGIRTGLLQYMSDEKNVLDSDLILGPEFKSPEQGAVTSVWGAVSRALEGTGGKYLEDAQIAKAYDASEGQWAPGYFPHAYNLGEEKKLWEMSLNLVGENE
ncbi:hypothetical protein BDV06DRAFT_215154 [Aspergillus oleicola]